MISADRKNNLVPLLEQVRACTLCNAQLDPRPVIQASPEARLLIIGQAPGSKVHKSGIPWDDVSGDRLRQWLNLDKEIFYNPKKVAIVPAAFCYPGKGKQGDLPPPKLCFDTWHKRVLAELPNIELTLLIGQYAQALYLNTPNKTSLTENVANFAYYSEQALWPLPHPSPRNRHWIANNPWFEQSLVPQLQNALAKLALS
ncbi:MULTISPECIES: uracil-DNA glycosylase family protein [unclassified Agarivorans]|uniref:uracil-DNA glycosylase family protein n=1 Tax=unclassified Agarivorans TaxID=2636026 RepID=UPI0026E33F39|nr:MULTISPECIES: uracil-DNA glycosylase family protein [unclassified Agarivorans]MDO6684538.1 uracil-DNA glycosylase family protein [Agarivorans sp. 3_MG-2023]MDO6714703.1 uracil-DNA glycosylase family protein [Agarivorans sp. 2_MG-2023]